MLKAGVSQVKKIHTLLNLEGMFRIIVFTFGLSDNKNTISEFCKRHYVNKLVHVHLNEGPPLIREKET